MARELVSGGQPAARHHAGRQPRSTPPGSAASQRTPPDSAGRLALAVASTIVIPARFGRITAIAFTALLTAVAGLSRIDLRARCASGVLAAKRPRSCGTTRSTVPLLAPPRPREALSSPKNW